MIAALASALVLLQARSFVLGKPITLEEPCIGTKQLMQKLSNQAGIKFSAIGDILNDNLAVRIKAIPLNDLMKRLADAESGEWESSDGSYQFRRSSKTLAIEAQATRRIKITSFLDSLRKIKQSIDEHPEFTDNWASQLRQKATSIPLPQSGKDASEIIDLQSKLYSELPPSRCLKRILLKFPIDQLIEIPAGDQVVFSTSPNPMQLPLPVEVSNELHTLEAEQQVWSDAAQPLSQGGYFYGAEQPGAYGPAKRLLIICSRNFNSPTLEVRMSLVAETGHILSSARLVMGDQSDKTKFVLAGTKQADTPRAIALTQKEQETIDFFEATGEGPHLRNTPISNSLRDSLLRPDQVPIASLFAGPILIRISKELNKNLVAVLTENLVNQISKKSQKKCISTTVLDDLKDPNTSIFCEEDSDSLTIRPRSFEEAADERINTVALSQLTEEARSTDNISVDSLAAFALASKEGILNNSIAESYLEAQVDSGFRPLHDNDFSALRLLGSMTVAQRQRGQTWLPISQLSGQQLDLLKRMVYGSNKYLEVTLNGVPDYTSVRWYPTEALPAGIPDSSYTRLVETKEDCIFAGEMVAGRYIGEQQYDEGTLAFVMSRTPTEREALLTLGSFQPTRLNRKILIFTFSKDASIRLILSDRQPKSRRVFNIQELPAEYRKVYDAVFPDYLRRANNAAP